MTKTLEALRAWVGLVSRGTGKTRMSDRLKDPKNISEGKGEPSVTVRVKLSGFLSSLVSESELQVEVDAGSTVADLIGMF